MTPPKNYTYTPLLSHMDKVTLSNTFTPIYLISTPPTRVIQMMLFYLMLGLAPHGLDLGFLGLGLLGLGPHLLQRLIRRTLNALALVHFVY